MTDRLLILLKSKKIQPLEYRTYMTFMGNDIGRSLLTEMLESIVMEEPLEPTKQLFAWHDGRRSVWRDIKRMIDNVSKQLEKSK